MPVCPSADDGGSEGGSASGEQVAARTTDEDDTTGALVSRDEASSSGHQTVVPPPSDVQITANALQEIPSTLGFPRAVFQRPHRFYVQLQEGATTVVSWTKLLKAEQRSALPIVLRIPPAANTPELPDLKGAPHGGLALTTTEASHGPLSPGHLYRHSIASGRIQQPSEGVGIALETGEKSPQPRRNAQPSLQGTDSDVERTASISSDHTAGDKRVHSSTEQNDANRSPPRVTTTAVSDPTHPVYPACPLNRVLDPTYPVRPREQSIIPKPQDNVQPTTDERDSGLHHTARLPFEDKRVDSGLRLKNALPSPTSPAGVASLPCPVMSLEELGIPKPQISTVQQSLGGGGPAERHTSRPRSQSSEDCEILGPAFSAGCSAANPLSLSSDDEEER